MLNKEKIEARIAEIDAVIVEQQKIFNQAQANILALTGAKNELVRMMQDEMEIKKDEEQENVITTND